MRWIAAFFIVLEALAAFWLGAVSRHGPAGLAWAAPSSLVLAPGLTWWAARRLAARPRPQAVALLVGVGVLMLGLAPASLFLLDRVEPRARRTHRLAHRQPDRRSLDLRGRGAAGRILRIHAFCPCDRPGLRRAD